VTGGRERVREDDVAAAITKWLAYQLLLLKHKFKLIW